MKTSIDCAIKPNATWLSFTVNGDYDDMEILGCAYRTDVNGGWKELPEDIATDLSELYFDEISQKYAEELHDRDVNAMEYRE